MNRGLVRKTAGSDGVTLQVLTTQWNLELAPTSSPCPLGSSVLTAGDCHGPSAPLPGCFRESAVF